MKNPPNASRKLPQPNTSRADKDGFFTNPFIWADVPDPDVIRVDDTAV